MHLLRYILVIPVFSAIAIAQQSPWSVLRDRADSLFDRHVFSEAIALGKAAVEAAEAQGAASDTVLGLMAHRLGLYCWMAGEYSSADSFLTEAERLRKQAFGPRSTAYARTLVNHANVYAALGKPDQSRTAIFQALEIGPESLLVTIYLNLAGGSMNDGDFASAEYFYTQALEAQQRVTPEDSVLRMQCLFALGYFRLQQGAFEESARLNSEALQISRSQLGPDHFWTQYVLTNLSAAYGRLGKMKEALQAAREDLRIQALYPDDPARRRLTLLNTSTDLLVLGQLDSARILGERLVHELDSTQSITPGAGIYFSHLADVYATLGTDRTADSLFSIALSLWEQESRFSSVSTEIPERAALFYRSRGKPGKALAIAGKACRWWMAAFPGVAARLSDREAQSLGELRRGAVQAFLSAFADISEPTSAQILEAAHLVFTTKGVITDLHAYRNALLLDRADSLSLALRAEYARLVSLVTTEVLSASSDSARSVRLDSLRGSLRSAEAALARVSGDFRILRQMHDITSDQISQLLPSGGVVLEYMKYGYHAVNPDTVVDRYLVVAIDGRGGSFVKDLGPADRIDAQVLRYRRHMNAYASDQNAATAVEYGPIGRSLYDMLLRPVERLLKGKRVLLLSPDAGLNLVSFAGLISTDGRYVVERSPVHYLTAARDLLRFQVPHTAGSGLLAIGDPALDAPAAPAADFRPDGPGRTFSTVPGYRAACLGSLEQQSLPFSRREVESVRDAWRSSHSGEPATVLLGAEAREDSFRRLGAGKRVLHLATHGFFLQGCIPQGRGRIPADLGGHDPLLLSGLLLAGAIAGRDSVREGDQDGLLTALEVSSMDLRSADLVVLSACETGLGEIRQGEGVYGLRRAFQTAGVRTVISTLWKVPDLETMKLMRDLYSQRPGTYPELMREAAVRRINELRLRHQPVHPFSWGAFTSTGEWRLPAAGH